MIDVVTGYNCVLVAEDVARHASTEMHQRERGNPMAKRPKVAMWTATGIVGVLALFVTPASAQESPTTRGQEARNIGSRLELFVDDWLIETMKDVALRLHIAQPREIVIKRDKPWEKPGMYDPVVIKDGDRYRMWYRTHLAPPPSYTAYAESPDGIRWTKPSLNLIDYNGSKENNLVWSSEGDAGHVLSVFKDGNPKAEESHRYKAIAIGRGGMLGLVSPDGIHWRMLQPDPIIVGPKGDAGFDSHNIAFWDTARQRYTAYLRGWRGAIRGIRRGISSDFRTWSELEYIQLGDSPSEHLYKNAATQYFRAPHVYLMFPKRFVPDRKSLIPGYAVPGLSDIVFMSSRDGLDWDRRFMEAFIRPGLDRENWKDRAIELGPTLVPTGPGEMSIYYMEHYGRPSVHVRRGALRTDGFISIHATYAGGEFVTKPLTFQGKELVLNYSTSAVGSLRVEIQDCEGKQVSGHGLDECIEIYGDELERPVSWKSGSDVSRLAGQPIRLRFVMRDADLYSIRFRP